MDRLEGIKARFILSDLLIDEQRYRCYYITENIENDYVMFWLHRRYHHRFVLKYFLIASMTDRIIGKLFLRVINCEDISDLGELSYEWE